MILAKGKDTVFNVRCNDANCIDCMFGKIVVISIFGYLIEVLVWKLVALCNLILSGLIRIFYSLLTRNLKGGQK